MPKHPFICAIVSDNSAAEQIELCQHSISSPVRIITTESSKCIVATKRVIEEGAAVIVSRGFGLKDPRSYGSGNPGATNVLRSGNKLAASMSFARITYFVMVSLINGNDERPKG